MAKDKGRRSADRAKMASDAAVEREYQAEQLRIRNSKRAAEDRFVRSFTFDEDGNPTAHFLASEAQFAKWKPTPPELMR